MSYSWQGGGFAYCASFVTLLWHMDCAEPPGARGNVARFGQAPAKACWLECRPATNRAIFMRMISGIDGLMAGLWPKAEVFGGNSARSERPPQRTK
jgi:hypothetical protein